MQDNTNPSPPPETIHYRNIPPSTGGPFPLSSPIGTRDCQTCVGLFIPISAEKCYVAHINATIRVGGSYTYLHKVQDDEGSRLEEKVLARLKVIASQERWDPQDVDASKVIVVCPRPDAPFVGWYVVNGISAFFGGRVGHEDVVRGCHGFVVDPERGKRYFLPSEGFTLSDSLEEQWVQEVGDRPYRFLVEELKSARDEWAPEVTRW